MDLIVGSLLTLKSAAGEFGTVKVRILDAFCHRMKFIFPVLCHGLCAPSVACFPLTHGSYTTSSQPIRALSSSGGL